MKKAFSFICVGLMALSCTGERAGDLINQDFAFAGQQLCYALTETENVRNSLGKTPEELPSTRTDTLFPYTTLFRSCQGLV